MLFFKNSFQNFVHLPFGPLKKLYLPFGPLLKIIFTFRTLKKKLNLPFGFKKNYI